MIKKDFATYHAENPQIWTAFERYTMQAINRGRTRLGAKTIFERIRWYSSVEATGDTFKINNNYTADYARMFQEKHPEHADFFQTRDRLTDVLPTHDNPHNSNAHI